MSTTLNQESLSILTPELVEPVASHKHEPPVIALLGNPNAGKTSLFNRLTGLRARTANFPGTTVEHRRAALDLGEQSAVLVDLPGLYSLQATTTDEQVAVDALEGKLPGMAPPDMVLAVIDSTRLERNLFLASQAIELGLPTVVVLTLSDAARRQGIELDVDRLSERLGCPVVSVSSRTGEGLDDLLAVVRSTLEQRPRPYVEPALASCRSCRGCHFAARHEWAASVSAAALRSGVRTGLDRTPAIDRVLTHRVWGLAAFALVMAATFLLIFWAATFPMELIDAFFGHAGELVGRWIPEGDLNSLLTHGVIGGVGGMLIFLPQICLLFFVLALLEDSGYMARAALVMDRLMHRVGLPGKAFVPLLSAHACAIPAIMSTRVIEDRRDRLATIMVLPLMSCSARMPVYAMVAALLFRDDPLRGGLLFAAAYLLGIVAALSMAWVFRHTLLKGPARPLIIELPNYRLPSLRTAALLTFDRATAFVKTAGTVILLISLVLWALATYPKTTIEEMPADVQAQLAQMQADGDEADFNHLIQQMELAHSFAGRIGHAVEPVFAPLGFDWKMSVGVLSSFAAREVIVSTLAVLYGLGAEGADDGVEQLHDSLRQSKRADGSPVFTTAACASLLVFYVLAMQCLPTQAVTRRETGSWKWPLVQLGYMTALAYAAAFITYQTLSRLMV